jgi:hypothetical protein
MKTPFKLIIVILFVSLVFPLSLSVAQFDAPYYALEERHKAVWGQVRTLIEKGYPI